jgi:hypothetical protein
MEILRESGHQYPAGIDYLPDPSSCVPSTFAYLMFRIGAPERFWHPSAIDTIIGRVPGELTHNSGEAIIALLEQGANLTDVNSIDNNRFIAEGLSYLVEHHQEGWLSKSPEGFYKYWTPERLKIQQEHTQIFLDKLKPFGDQWKSIATQPTMAMLTSAVSAGGLVMAKTHSTDLDAHHSNVILGVDIGVGEEENKVIFFENEKQPPIKAMKLSNFERLRFNPKSSITILHNPIN